MKIFYIKKTYKVTYTKINLYLFKIKLFSYKSKKLLSPVDFAKKIGVSVGENVRFICHPKRTDLPDFGSEPFFISIGNNVCISFGVTFLTHDAGVHVYEKWLSNGEKIYKYGKITIGNNCFIGCKSILLPGITIGDNCVIGAGSVVTKDIPSGEVWAGNPAHFITTTEQYGEKNYKKWLSDPEQKQLFNDIIKHRKLC